MIHFLDLSIARKPTRLEISIYRKPTTTDMTINFLSNNPLEHKLAAYRFLIQRMLTLPINREQQFEEWQCIQHIACCNNFPPPLLNRLKLKMQRSLSQQKPPTSTTKSNGTKWATFTYISPQIRNFMNIFRHTNVRIAFKCNNTILQLSKPQNKDPPSAPTIGVASMHFHV
jgi:hypothetical protein